MAEEPQVQSAYEFHSQLLAKGQRADTRDLNQFREVKLEVEAIRTADSSSLVKLGSTILVCGCTIQQEEPEEKPSDRIRIKIELPPICSTLTKHLRTQLITKSLKCILDDTKCLEQLDLYLEECDRSLDVEIRCLNYDGSLLDAALLALLAAVKVLKFEGGTRKFDISTPICSFFAVIDDHIICDPTAEEEAVAQTNFSITIDPSAKGRFSINKVGGKSINNNELIECIQLAEKRATHMQEMLTNLSKR